MPTKNVGPGIPGRTTEAQKKNAALQLPLSCSTFHIVGQAAQLAACLQLTIIALHQLGVL